MRIWVDFMFWLNNERICFFCLRFVCVRENVLPCLFWFIWVDCAYVSAAVWDFVFE